MTLVLRDVVLPLADFALEVSVEMHARTTALFGPSGAGKTSLLEIVAGLRTPSRGRVELHGRVVFDENIDLPPRLRRIGYVAQDDALFPHLSVRRNVFYGAHESPKHAHAIEVLEIAALMDRSVAKLSGGERKRVALARALLSDPEILLLDEPMAGIDAALRARVLAYLIRVRDEFPVPMVYVTHHREEAAALCDEVVFLERGRIVTGLS
ncbi:MAG TPA: ATP-binding cassette domain-containing protein [Thermoanaerobaculia bacterium]|nr:ATP-binding cassette domain-containing protein [Thermoanaerobaculia bacterium]